MHTIAGKAVAFGEALKDDFKVYQQNIVKNCACLAEDLISKGFKIISGGTDNHLMLVDLRPFDVTGKDLEKKLDEVHITANKNSIPNDPNGTFVTSGLRIGTPAVTTRGFGIEEMHMIANWIYDVTNDFENNKDRITKEVVELCAKYPVY